jgi:hypothetical protein
VRYLRKVLEILRMKMINLLQRKRKLRIKEFLNQKSRQKKRKPAERGMKKRVKGCLNLNKNTEEASMILLQDKPIRIR